MDDDLEFEDGQETMPETQTFSLTDVPTITHSFDHIVGNQLMCSSHDTCTSVTVSPTVVLEMNEKGEMQLVDKAVR